MNFSGDYMSIYINLEVIAIAKRVKELLPNIQQYYINIPSGFKRPSVYFPTPTTRNSNLYLKSNQSEYTLSVKVFGKEVNSASFENDSMRMADSILYDIMNNRRLVQMVDQTGSKVDNYIRILRAETRENGPYAAVLSLSWKSEYNYIVADAELMQNLDLDVNFEE